MDVDLAYMRCSRCYILRAADSASPILTPVAPYSTVMLPGFNNVQGLWPAIWAMGNLGRAGYGATLDGMVRRQ